MKDIENELKDKLFKKNKLNDLLLCIGASPYIARVLINNQQWIEDLFLNEEIENERYTYPELEKADIDNLRKLAKKEHVRIGIRDLLNKADIPSILKELSALADTIIKRICTIEMEKLREKMGSPIKEKEREPVTYSVIAMGKLGGEELNYYSDIDLMYLYETHIAKTEKNIEAHEFFTRFFENVTKQLSAHTQFGKLYNVDLRLRPQGRRGLICLPLDAYEDYYQNFGRTWERLALIRARGCAGSQDLFKEFEKRIRPFVYRKYIDFSEIEQIKELKKKLEIETKSKKLDIKNGTGGIREIEFIVQTFQIIFGAREPFLISKNTFIALHRLFIKGLLNHIDYEKLYKAYSFYRKLENRLQIINCIQTHSLPSSDHELKRLAGLMGFEGDYAVDALLQEINTHKRNVSEIFEQFMSEESIKERPSIIKEEIKDKLKKLGFEDINGTFKAIVAITEGKPMRPIPASAAKVAKEIIENIIEEAAETAHPDMAIKNMEDIADIMRYSISAFYNMLKDNPNIRKLFIKLSGDSQYISRIMITNPDLIENITDFIGKRIPKPDTEIKRLLDESKELPYETFIKRLRKYKQTSVLQIGINHILDLYSTFAIFYEWSKLADIILNTLHKTIKESTNTDVAIIGLGKLGSRELTYHSDLDIIFVGENKNQDAYTAFYRKFIRALTYKSIEGFLFEIDTRLRPFGSKGVMVNTPDDLHRYFSKFARIWERLAFTRTRIIAKDNNMSAIKAKEIIEDFVYEKAIPENFEKEILNMRTKLENELGKNPNNLKYSKGAIVDIEFIAQYLSIKYKLYSNSTLNSIAKAFKKGYIDFSTYKMLKDGYIFLRELENRCRLIFYPPLKDFPSDKKKVEMIAKTMKVKSDQLIFNFNKTKRAIREIFMEIFV